MVVITEDAAEEMMLNRKVLVLPGGLGNEKRSEGVNGRTVMGVLGMSSPCAAIGRVRFGSPRWWLDDDDCELPTLNEESRLLGSTDSSGTEIGVGVMSWELISAIDGIEETGPGAMSNVTDRRSKSASSLILLATGVPQLLRWLWRTRWVADKPSFELSRPKNHRT